MFFDTAAYGFFVPKSKFNIEDIPDLSGKVAIVTGANAGIGKLTAQHLLEKNARVYAACRSEEKALAAIEEIKASTKKTDIHFLRLDLGSIKQCVGAGEEFLRKETRLDMLINSAGVMFTPVGDKTSDGLDMQFGTNVLGHFALTQTLVPLLISTSQTSPPGSVRMVWLSSSGHFGFTPASGIDYASITADETKLSTQVLYGQSKLGDIHLAREYAARLRDHGIISVSLHPGNIATDLMRHENCYNWLIKKVVPLYPPSLGCLTQLYAATSPEVTMADTGSYYVPWARKYHPSHPKAEDPVATKATWDFCVDQVQKVMSS